MFGSEGYQEVPERLSTKSKLVKARQTGLCKRHECMWRQWRNSSAH
jgi:hypothetical protein